MTSCFFALSYHKCPPKIKIENFQITVYIYAYPAKNYTKLLVMLLMCICLYFYAHYKCLSFAYTSKHFSI
jgi:hypothetical protein